MEEEQKAIENATDRLFREEAERDARLTQTFPGFLGEFLVEMGRLVALGFVVGPWVLFWMAPTGANRQAWLVPHIGPLPHLILLHYPNWLPVLVLPVVILLLALLFGVVFPVDFWPTRNVRASAYNVLAFATLYAALIGTYATTYLELAHNYRRCFGQRLTHVEALYFTVTTFTTTGFGDITAKSPGCRLIVASQTLVGLVVITLAIAALVARLLRQHEDHRSS